jgi:cellulose biosynthesis protein BcsQ
MALYLAIANRKGGVGKSSVSVMLAYALSVWGGKRVLVIDVDSQCNASMILLGGRGWRDARNARRTIADYFTDFFKGRDASPSQYLVSGVGDVTDSAGRHPPLDLLTGSLMLDDVQGDFFLDMAGNSMVSDVMTGLRGRFESLLRRCEASYDVVILDCAPGLSFATLAAISTADRVIVPFRPDYVSLMAIDRVALIIERVANFEQLAAIPLSKRRYACLPNYVRPNGAERLLIEEAGLTHPLMSVALAQRDGIANAFDWSPERCTLEAKYTDAIPDLRRLYQEVAEAMAKPQTSRTYHGETYQQALGA